MHRTGVEPAFKKNMVLLSSIAIAVAATAGLPAYLDARPALLPDISGLWASPSENFTLVRHQPSHAAAATPNTVYRRRCGDHICGHCYLTPTYDYDTRELKSHVKFHCDGSEAEGTFSGTDDTLTFAGRR